jgi:DUF4097 and DUF4098 domain-containing protein YvlB
MFSTRKYEELEVCMKYAVSACLCAALLFGATEELDRSYEVKPGTELHMEAVNGDIEIMASGNDKIEIHAVKRTKKEAKELDKVEIIIEPGTEFEIKTKYLKDDAEVSVDFMIKIPKHIVELDIKNVNGDISIQGVTCDAGIELVNGEINIEKVKGFVELELANGDINVKDTEHVTDIELANGKVMVELKSISDDGLDIEIANGTVKVYLAEHLDVDIEAANAIGRISIEGLDIAMTGIVNSLDTKIGDGGPVISVEAAVGDIFFNKLAK